MPVLARNRRHCFSEEGRQQGRHHWTYVAGGVGGDTVNGIGVVLRNRQRIAEVRDALMPLAVFSTKQVFAAGQRQGQRLGLSG